MPEMLEQTTALLAALQKPSTNVDQRLQLFNNLKSSIKHSRVPEEAQAPIFDCIRIAISATTSAALVSTGFSTLSHFIKRLQLQRETNVITSQANKLCALLLDRLGDARESHRSAASVILGDLHNLCPAEVDALIHGAMKGTNARAKDTSMAWVVRMNKNEGVPFRTYSTQLVANLEDADAGVRDTAKHAVVDLFSTAPEHAKANLKKQLIATNVRKTIATYITTHLDEDAVAVKEVEMPPPAPVARPIPVQRAATLQPDHGIAEAMAGEIPPPTETVSMDPLHIYTQRELEDMFRDMAPPFEGRETEHNWIPRDKNTTKLRRVLKGNAPEEFTAVFIAGIKSLLDGILKVANTLRTTMSTNGCLLVQELAKTLGHAVDPWVEILLQNFIKMCAATKNIAAQNGNVTVDIVISNATFNNRMLQHVSFASQDKNVQPRCHSASWVKTLIRKHKTHIEHSGNMDTLEKIIKKGVTDANPKVREAYRSTYWTFALVWPQRAEIMFETFDKREKTGLEKDANNPNASLASSQNSTASFSKSVGAGAARNALKEKIAEQRRAKLAASKGVPERPSSAAATYTPAKSQSAKSLTARTASNTSTASSASARPPSAMSGESTKSALKSSTGTGSLMSGTVRRPIRRPELTRPATADPYAVRRAGGGAGKTTPSMTPEKTPAAATAKKSVAPKSSSRPRSQTQNSPTVSPIRSKSRLGQSTTGRPAATGSRHGSPAVSPAKDENLTMVKPFVRSQSHHDPATIPFRQRHGLEKPSIVDNEAVDVDDEDNFTMVIPSLTRPAAQPTQRTPPKPTQSSGRLAAPSPRASALRSPKSMGDIPGVGGLRSSTRSPRLRSPDRPSTRGTDAQDEVQVFEDPFVGDEPSPSEHDLDKPVLGELPINEKNIDRRVSNSSTTSDPMMGNASEDRPRGHHKTTSTGSVLYGDNDANHAEVLKNRQLLASGIRKIEGRTVEAHMFRRMQDMVKSNQDIWGTNDENFGRLLLACLEFLQTPTEKLKTSVMKAANLKVQALATIRAMLALYRRETAKYFSRVLCAILQTKSQHENTSHIANDLETTADEIVRYGQTLDCLNAVLALVEDTPTSTPTSSPNSKASSSPVQAMASTRTTTMALTTLASLIEISGIKNINLTPEQTSRLGKLAVRCMDAQDADVRKADIELCVALHERIVGPGAQREDDGFWKAVAGARDQHLNLLTYYLAKKGKA